jgi:predicted nucleic acid-binding protein
MKYVIDASIAEAWYILGPNTMKALQLRLEFHRGGHELLAPDVFPAEAAEMLVKAELKGLLPTGSTSRHLNTLEITGVSLHPSFPLLARASEITITGRLQLFPSLYVALAEREQCQLLTADQKLLRNTRRHFQFVVSLASIP